MGGNGVDEYCMGAEVESSETTIEIKIKTLDSQTYTLRVNKQMPVPALKDQIASVTGVLSEKQRLICHGKVLKDDQLLSAYHVEDGHTLHLVVREPMPSSSESLPGHPADTVPSTGRSQESPMSHSVVVETFSMPDHGDGVLPDISRIVSAVLGSFGINGVGTGSGRVDVGVHRPEGIERTPSGINMTDSTQLHPGMRSESAISDGTLRIPTAVSLGPLQPPVIPDSLTTLSEYLSHLRHEIGASAGEGRGSNVQAAGMHGNEERESRSASHSRMVQEALPTPASLAEVLLSTRQMLIEQTGDCLFQLARELENQVTVTDPVARLSTQTSAWRTGVLIQNLGAFFLELGRTTMTLRLGRTPSGAVVNAGPAVFISPSGPNPLMVQPLPFRPGASFGTIPSGTMQAGSTLFNGLGSSPAGNSVDQEEHVGSLQPSGQRDPETGSAGQNPVNQATSGVSEGLPINVGSGVRVVPIRTMVAAVPSAFGRLHSDSSGGPLGLYYPVIGRFQPVTPGNLIDRRGSQASSENRPNASQTEQQLVPGTAVQHQNVDIARDGSLTPFSSGQQQPPQSRSSNINILSSAGTQHNQESGGQITNGVVEFLRTLFPGGEIHVEDVSSQGIGTGSVTQPAGPTSSVGVVQGPDPRPTEEGIFLSNLLHRLMPSISQLGSSEQNVVRQEEAVASEHGNAQDSFFQAENSHVGTSRQQSDLETSPPNSKRQKVLRVSLLLSFCIFFRPLFFDDTVL
ncbi:ubiquitin-like domain-containing protein CIP73 isoform X4 [Malania oleifera]|uniref:ubiquitin-like domain-containing protein CIP73 isoform X4 n=1 Tax=Malania oleifera TaxID=397392 RepID=UPI0025AE97C7|nr:ubiquitin-like domain-containing protein CIP73 isoform X4 [Malania oleifera]